MNGTKYHDRYQRNIRSHARRRAEQRYGLELSKRVRRAICIQIRTGNVELSRRLTLSRTLHLVNFEGITLPIVFSKTFNDIVTVLPPDSWQVRQAQIELTEEALAAAAA